MPFPSSSGKDDPLIYYTYLLRCADDSFYCGITTDPDRRFREHAGSPQGAKFTRSHPPLCFEALWRCPDRAAASVLEYRIKQLTRAQKLSLIAEGINLPLPDGCLRIPHGAKGLITRPELTGLCLSLANTYEDYPFGDNADRSSVWTVIRHRGSRRCFAFIFERQGLCINLKCDPLQSSFLRRHYQGITPAYHMNKEHWNTLQIDSDLPFFELKALIAHSYTLTLSDRNVTRHKNPSPDPAKNFADLPAKFKLYQTNSEENK